MSDTILLISADPQIVQHVREACAELEAELVTAAGVSEAETFLRDALPNLILCDYGSFTALRRQFPRASVVLYTEPADSEQTIEAIKQGAIDYLVTPIAHDELVEHLRDALRISRDIHVPAVYEDPRDDDAVERIIGQSPAMKEVYKLIGRIAPRDVNVLITGESGTGKELVARAILHHSPRRNKPYLPVNCAAIPETLLESELFGHEKGAFTGATLRRIGKFEQCNEGTLFLDEIGDIPLPTQARLLRVLQDNTFQRLGGAEVIRCDMRIIAATHQPLETLIAQGRFRQDLYYRLKVATIHVPPLREREVDVVLLAHHLVRRYNRLLGTQVRTFSPEVLPTLLKYPWPGNVRELENAIKASLVVARGSVLRLEFLPAHIRRGAATDAAGPLLLPTADEPLPQLRALAESLAGQTTLHGRIHDVATGLIEREVIRACLHQTRGQIAPAARMLGLSRTTLRRKMAAHRIQATVSVDFDPGSREGHFSDNMDQ